MKPPRCAFCGKDFRKAPSSGALLSFALTEDQKEQKKRFKEKRIVGHPPGKVWLCVDHKDIGKKYTHLTWSEARLEMQKKRPFSFLSIIYRFFRK